MLPGDGPCRWDLCVVRTLRAGNARTCLSSVFAPEQFVCPTLARGGRPTRSTRSTAALAAAAGPIVDKTEDRDVAGLFSMVRRRRRGCGRGAFVAGVPLADPPRWILTTTTS